MSEKWINAREEIPQTRIPVWACHPDREKAFLAEFQLGSFWELMGERHRIRGVTHWMLPRKPALPEAGE